jgi:hypothetical protein
LASLNPTVAIASGDAARRSTAAEMFEAEQQVRRIIGHADLAKSQLRSNATRLRVARPCDSQIAAWRHARSG